jgi:hypothetical protein
MEALILVVTLPDNVCADWCHESSDRSHGAGMTVRYLLPANHRHSNQPALQITLGGELKRNEMKEAATVVFIRLLRVGNVHVRL